MSGPLEVTVSASGHRSERVVNQGGGSGSDENNENSHSSGNGQERGRSKNTEVS